MLHKSGIKLLMAVLLLGFSAFGVKAVTYTVTTTNDSGAGSLRAAITSANGQTANDTIVFDIPSTDFNCTNGVCTIILTSGEIPVNANSSTGRITITNAGGANKIIVSGNNNFRVFNVTMGDSAAFIDSLTISNGNANGTNFNGGGILVTSLSTSSQVLTINNSTVSSNTAQLGGGLYVNDAKVTITNSTFNNNRAFNLGGAIQLYSENAFVTIVNSTISGNQAAGGGGITNLGGNLTIINSTISTNQAPTGSCGGIYNNDFIFTKTYIRNTIISANTAAGQPDVCHGTGDTFTSNGNNLIGNTGDTNHAISWQSSDLLNRQPRLSPLVNNGGATQTHALQNDSDAINRGSNCVLTANGCGDGNAALSADQRGSARQSGLSVDIGAFELQQSPTTRRTLFDFDGDGKSDVAVTRTSGGNLTWYLLNSQTGFTGVNFGVGTDRIVPADYDGDGKTDIAVVRTNSDNSLSWYILQSQAGFTGQTFGVAGDTPVPADFDGDGKADVAVTRASGGALNFYINRSQLGFTGLQFGAAGDVPVVGDYDADGKADAAVARQSGGNLNWYINRSQLGFAGYQFGLATDKPVAADYDGDGKTDVAVARTSGGNISWYLLQSTAGFTGVGFGAAGDVPVPADYDGDGKTDVAVARASGGALNWYLLRSQSGFTGVAFGASTDRAVENAYIP